MNVFISPLKYLRLRNEKNRRVAARDLAATVLFAGILSLPFIVFDGVNFFRPGGFAERIGALASVLTGFYIAALVAVATFASQFRDLDAEIQIGKIYLKNVKNSEPEELTRREYVCSIFGYLAFLSLSIAVIATVFVIVAPLFQKMTNDMVLSFRDFKIDISHLCRIASVGTFNLLVSSMIITTFYGLYYLTDRIYDEKPKVLPKDAAKRSTTGGALHQQDDG